MRKSVEEGITWFLIGTAVAFTIACVAALPAKAVEPVCSKKPELLRWVAGFAPAGTKAAPIPADKMTDFLTAIGYSWGSKEHELFAVVVPARQVGIFAFDDSGCLLTWDGARAPDPEHSVVYLLAPAKFAAIMNALGPVI